MISSKALPAHQMELHTENSKWRCLQCEERAAESYREEGEANFRERRRRR